MNQTQSTHPLTSANLCGLIMGSFLVIMMRVCCRIHQAIVKFNFQKILLLGLKFFVLIIYSLVLLVFTFSSKRLVMWLEENGSFYADVEFYSDIRSACYIGNDLCMIGTYLLFIKLHTKCYQIHDLTLFYHEQSLTEFLTDLFLEEID